MKKKAVAIHRIIKKTYPDAECSLVFKSPLQLLVATILSAQCTDVRVNKVTRELFKKYKKVKDFADADIEELQEDIRSTGFYKNKAKNIKACCGAIVREHGGRVPDSMDELVKLAGIGRKTANVVLGNAYDTPGVVVDTHVGRVAQRLGLTENKDAVKIEYDLMELFPKNSWTMLSHQFIQHGRKICASRSPKCGECPLLKYCDYGQEQDK